MFGAGVREHGAAEIALAILGARKLFQHNLRQVLTTGGAQGVAIIKTEFRTVRSATSTGVLTNRLRGAYAFAVEMAPVGGTLRIGGIRPTDGGKVPRHLAVHEGIDASGNQVSQFVIRPRKSRFLAIPLAAAKTKAGVSRGGPRMYPNTFVVFGGLAGEGVIYMKVGKDRVVPLFALKRQVILKARPSLPTVKARLAQPLTRRCADAAQAALIGQRLAA